jgi:hypothetical protein
MLISTLYTPMRVVLGDNDTQGSQEFTDDQLADGVRTAYLLASFPRGTNPTQPYQLTDSVGGAVDLYDGDTITPNPPVVDFAIMMCEACQALMVGDQGAFSVTTRAISETDHGERKRDILQYVRQRIHDLRDGDAVFATRENFTAFMMTLDSFADLAEVKQSGAINIDVNVASDNVSIFL